MDFDPLDQKLEHPGLLGREQFVPQRIETLQGLTNIGLNKPVAYVKPSPNKKDGRAVAVYEMTQDEITSHLVALRQIAVRLGRFLALSNDAEELAGLLVPNYDTFWWSNPIARANGMAVYGF
jgi:hypothetical protein